MQTETARTKQRIAHEKAIESEIASLMARDYSRPDGHGAAERPSAPSVERVQEFSGARAEGKSAL